MCITDRNRIQWIAEPFINATGSTFILNNNAFTLGTNVTRGPITIEHTAVNPFITRLFMNGSLIQVNTSVTCATFTDNATLHFFPDGKCYCSLCTYVYVLGLP